jgi:2-polyprenyl-3-methyl-5-hydroxy-6-metoxy-1,4-benzoquinol methylase
METIRSKYTKEEIEAILAREKFEYHRVNLPYGLHTPGQDRSKILSIIFPDDFRGQSILDIGCGLGYFCFEAEKRNAGRIVGIEYKESRYRQILILKDILNSKIEVVKCNFEEDDYSGEFDYVLLLNVIHHLKDPIKVLRRIASMVKKRFIIEFPTFTDRKLISYRGFFLGRFLNRFPLIGVNYLGNTGSNQTFVFTPSAIYNILWITRSYINPSRCSNRLIKDV